MFIRVRENVQDFKIDVSASLVLHRLRFAFLHLLIDEALFACRVVNALFHGLKQLLRSFTHILHFLTSIIKLRITTLIIFSVVLMVRNFDITIKLQQVVGFSNRLTK